MEANLADMQWMNKFNKLFRFLLFVIDIYIKYTWVIPLKGKEAITSTNAFQNTLNESKCKPSKIWVDKGSEFYNRSVNHGCKIIILKFIQHITKKNLLLLKDSLKP